MSAIKAGDLVILTRGRMCCGNTGHVGRVYKVRAVTYGEAKCRYCGVIRRLVYAASPTGPGYDVRRLIKIDPPQTPEHVEHREELTAS